MSGFVTPRPSSSGTHATRITKTFHHSAGAAIVAATGTSQSRSVRAPKATTTRATTRRIGSEIWIAAGGTSIAAGAWTVIASMNSRQSCGARTNETAVTAAVAPSAIASCRHSRRNANQARPMPGVIFVRRTTDQVAGHRKPTTIASAIRRLTLPR